MKNDDLNLTYKLLEEFSKNNKRMFIAVIFLILVVISQFVLPYIMDSTEISQTIKDNKIENSKVKNEAK